MARVCAPVITNDDVAVFGEDIYDFALAFIAPLQSYDATIHNRPLNLLFNTTDKINPRQKSGGLSQREKLNRQ
jgi:hypothetical protein